MMKDSQKELMFTKNRTYQYVEAYRKVISKHFIRKHQFFNEFTIAQRI